MRLAQNKIKWLARLMLALVLFAQGIVAANACVSPSASPAQAFSMAQQDEDAMPCHAQKTLNANVCLSHCTQSDQISADQHPVPLTAPVNVIARISFQPQSQRILALAANDAPALDTGPPIPIRFCSLLN